MQSRVLFAKLGTKHNLKHPALRTVTDDLLAFCWPPSGPLVCMRLEGCG